MNRLEGKIAVVTGSARGIGRAIVEKLAAHGAKMVISCDMGESSYEQGNVVHKILNVTDREAIKTFVDEIEKEYGKIDILVNNAGITKDGLLMRMTEDQWDAVINVNLKGVFNMTQAVSRSMLKARKGSIFSSLENATYGHTGIVCHVFEDESFLVVEQNYSVSGNAIGKKNTYSYRLISKGASERNGFSFAYGNESNLKLTK